VIAEIITDIGGDPSNAPRQALELGGAALCGFELVDPENRDSSGDPAARRCFLNAAINNVERVLVQRVLDPNGPIIHVYRVDPDRGAVIDHSDADGWTGRVCANVVDERDLGPFLFRLTNCSPL